MALPVSPGTVSPRVDLGTRAAALLRDRSVLRLGGFVVGGALVVALTPGTGSLAALPSWWAGTVAYQKFAVWGLLWALLGSPGVAHWLRPGTIRLPPWPKKVLATAGTCRGRVDVALYAIPVLLATALLLGPAPGGGLPRGLVWALLAALCVLGLRDKVPFLAARPDVYLPLLLVLACPPSNTIFAAKLCFAGWWWGRAVATANRHFPAVVASAVGGARARTVAFALPVAETVLPLTLLLARGGAVVAVAVPLMVAVVLADRWVSTASTPAEADAFLVFSAVALFGARAGVGAATLTSWVLTLLLGLLLAGRVVLGLAAPRCVSAVLSLRCHTGSEPVSLWLVRTDASGPARLLATAAADHRSGALPRRATLRRLAERVTGDLGRYRLLDGDAVAGAVLGCSLGDGRLAGGALLDALSERVDVGPGQLRLVTLAGQRPGGPVHYRVTDAATGKVEEGRLTRREVLHPERGLAPEITFRVLPPVRAPKVVRPPRPSPRPRPVRQPEPVRLGADGQVLRHRPLPHR